ncbi:MAG: SDR family NAD(P)-dependent oxidoreductase [candidate division Zixibacteria bacterium]|nr:SDR family NAD(P)-dependent oxidoreductase [candidate division Zixibacteria bacterium]
MESSAQGKIKKVIICGAGEAGEMIAREIAKHPRLGLKAVAFLDDDRRKTGREVAGVPVVGVTEEVANVARRYGADEVLIAMPSAAGSAVRRIAERCIAAALTYRILPGIFEIIHGDARLSQLREVEVEDLLKRDPIELDLGSIRESVTGKTILVTGAGGSIGSELCRQLTSFEPANIILMGHGENSIFNVALELEQKFAATAAVPVVGDVRDPSAVSATFEKYNPDIVYHAAAHKHITLMEQNVEEAVKNNVTGTRVAAEEAIRAGAGRFVLISTDKAVNPASAMGASKMVAELAVQCLRSRGPTEFVTVRFGNVLGSRGSVITLFKKQISQGGPVTITHREMTRYFMTVYEAVQLLIQASAIGQNGEIMILDMGKPVRIVDLAYDLIRLSGYVPEKDVAIEFVGIKPGERLSEELFASHEDLKETAIDEIMVAIPPPVKAEVVMPKIRRLEEAAAAMDHDVTVQLLRELSPSYKPTAGPFRL